MYIMCFLYKHCIIRWFEEAAKQGDAVAHYFLAVFHTHEMGGLKRDTKKEIRSLNLCMDLWRYVCVPVHLYIIVRVCVRGSVHLSSPSIYLSNLSVHLSMYVNIYIPIYLSYQSNLSIYLSIYLFSLSNLIFTCEEKCPCIQRISCYMNVVFFMLH